MKKELVQYIGAYLTNASAQQVNAIFSKVLNLIDEYLDEFEIDNEFDLSIIKPDTYHVTFIDSTEKFECFPESIVIPDDVETVDLNLHENYIVLELMSDKIEDYNSYFLDIGADQNWDYYPYIALARIEGDFSEEEVFDILDYVSDRLFIDMKIYLETVFALEDSSKDPEKNPNSYL